MEIPLISIIIAAYNSEKKIKKCLESLLKQTYKKIEIIIVDDGSDDNTKEIIKKFIEENKKINTILLEQERQGPGAAKNLAVKKAKGEILIFVDSDEYPKQDYIEKLTYPIRKNLSETSAGAWYIAYPKSPWARCRFEDTSKIRIHGVNSKVFRAIKKEDFEKIGGFNPKKGYSDDRLGEHLKKAQVKTAIFDHDVDSNIKELYEKRKWIGSSIMNNPKPLKFWIKLLGFFIGLSFFIFSFWIDLRIPLIILIIGLIPLIHKTIKKTIFYKDLRLLFYYPIYTLIIILGMLKGFFFAEYNK